VHPFAPHSFSHSSLTHVSSFTTLGEALPLVPPQAPLAAPPPPPMLSLSLNHPSEAKGFHSTPILACHYDVLLFLLLIIISCCSS